MSISNPLVQIVQILRIEDVGLNNLELAYILGYQSLVPKNKYKTNDNVVYIFNDVEVDIRHPIFAFLTTVATRAKCTDWFLIQTKKFSNKYFSDGIILSVDDLQTHNLTIDTLPIRKYSKPFEQQIANHEKAAINLAEINTESKAESKAEANTYDWLNLKAGSFPSHIIPKTDELNLETRPELLQEILEHECYLTLKLDGSSMTLIWNLEPNKITICSRNLILGQLTNQMVKYVIELENKTNFVDKLKSKYPTSIVCIQGEFVGPKINGNQLCLGSDDYYMFSAKIIKNLDRGSFLSMRDLIELSEYVGIKMVPILNPTETIPTETIDTLDKLKNFTNNLKYTFNPKPSAQFYAEGVVIRTKEIIGHEKTPQYFLSGKVISKNYKIPINLK